MSDTWIVLGIVAWVVYRWLRLAAAQPAAPVQDCDYEFQYRRVGAEWRAYIMGQPGYRGRPSDERTTHRMCDRVGWYICWSEPIRSRQACRRVAWLWARRTDRYIATGQRF